jgi:hypothetical protein
VALVFVVGGLWLFKKTKNFVEGAAKNPAVAAAKVVVAANPELEIVSADEEGGTVTIRNKKTGEVITLDAKDIEKGKLVFRSEKGEEIRIEGGEKEGSVKFSSEKGELTFGGGGSLPAWIPLPEGAKPTANYAAKEGEKEAGGAGFESQQSPEELLRFYETAMKGGGFAPSVSKFEQDGRLVGGMVSGKDKKGRELHVTVTSQEGKTSVALIYSSPGS